MSSGSQRQSEQTPTRASIAAARRKKAAYMRAFRSRLDVAERPEARVVDRVLVAALGLHLQSADRSEALDLLQALYLLAQAGLEVEGYDSKAARAALRGRMQSVLDNEDASNCVRVAARRKKEGLPATGRRVRHPDRLATA